MRIGAALALLAALMLSGAGCSRGDLFRQYEYEEEIFLSLDGSATVDVNSSVAALVALRGASFDVSPSARIDRNEVRDWFASPVSRVVRTPTLSRRRSRRFIHVRMETDDISRLSTASPFAWSSYRFVREGDVFQYEQTVGPSAAEAIGDVGWTGQELVGFRLHLPSSIVYHNAGAANQRRGNILVWEQSLVDRIRGEPLTFEARIESTSILSRTLLLFAATGLAVVLFFGLVIWWMMRHPGARGSIR
jgi:hypothetical protein